MLAGTTPDPQASPHFPAAARSLKPKHAIKQVDRLLSNPAINVDDILVRWVPFVIGARDTIVVAMDWTDFDADKQATIGHPLPGQHCGDRRRWGNSLRCRLGAGWRTRTERRHGHRRSLPGRNRRLHSGSRYEAGLVLGRQPGLHALRSMPTMRDDWLGPLMHRFSQMLQQQPLFADVFGPV
jgi:hypothetical protein